MTLKDKAKILGVGITTDGVEDILEYLIETVRKSKKKIYVVTPNPEIIYYSTKNPQFQKVLNQAQIALPDGVGILVAGNILGKGIKSRITGVDFMEKVCEAVANEPITVGFLGGKHNVAEMTVECLKEKFPGLRVAFFGPEWNEIEAKWVKPKCDILFVAFGFPKQELWIAQNLPKIDVKVAITVGGAFDFMSGKTPRAPKVIQKAGMEWFFRLLIQPWRIKRQSALIYFVLLILKERLKFKL